MNQKLTILNLFSWLFGTVVVAMGVLNTFWGNDLGFGIFLLLLSLVYFLPVNVLLQKVTGFSVPKMGILKVLLGVFILVAALGVGELFDKIDLMMMDF